MAILHKCPICGAEYLHPDDTAVHLMDAHRWSYDRTLGWLRDAVEEVLTNA